jgi:epoxyqueuosine reductase QueG
MRSEWSLKHMPAFPEKVLEDAREVVLLRLKIQAPTMDERYWQDLIMNPRNDSESDMVWNAILEAALAIANASKITLCSMQAIRRIEHNCGYMTTLRAMQQHPGYHYFLRVHTNMLEGKMQHAVVTGTMRHVG